MATTEQRLAEYEELFKKAQSFDPNRFKGEFEKSYGEATNYNQDLINQQSQALGQLQSVAPTLREKYANTLISDPTKQMSLIAQARQAPITQYGTAANLLTARGNRYQDILGKAFGAYQTDAEQANSAAENAWRLYQDAVAQQEAARARAASSGGSSIADLLAQLYGGGQTQDVVEDNLDITVPDSSLGNKLIKSAGGKTDTSKWLGTDALGLPSILGTGVNLLGNLLGNIQVPKRKNQSFLDKLFNR